jgi:aryl-phospho-beta-D-glucosidase BglC (GH1 family)
LEFFTLGREWCVGTEFEEVCQVYRGPWDGVLVDFHAVYGVANGNAHSVTSSGHTGLWGNRENLERTGKALGWIAKELKGVENLIGIQVVNEAKLGADGMWTWCESVFEGIRAVNLEIPIYISGWIGSWEGVEYM